MKKEIITIILSFTILIVVLSTMGYGLYTLNRIIEEDNISKDEQRTFCYENGGMAIEPTRETYNQLLCLFHYEKTYVEYGVDKITNKEWAEATGHILGNYCFVCWDSPSCSSKHNDILREKGVHC